MHHFVVVVLDSLVVGDVGDEGEVGHAAVVALDDGPARPRVTVATVDRVVEFPAQEIRKLLKINNQKATRYELTSPMCLTWNNIFH